MNEVLINAGSIDEIKIGKTKRIIADDKKLLICNVDNNFYTVDDMCTHEDSSLYLGCLKGNEVECSLHGGKFNVITGEATIEPAEVSLKTYKTIIRDGQIFIDLGNS